MRVDLFLFSHHAHLTVVRQKAVHLALHVRRLRVHPRRDPTGFLEPLQLPQRGSVHLPQLARVAARLQPHTPGARPRFSCGQYESSSSGCGAVQGRYIFLVGKSIANVRQIIGCVFILVRDSTRGKQSEDPDIVKNKQRNVEKWCGHARVDLYALP